MLCAGGSFLLLSGPPAIIIKPDSYNHPTLINCPNYLCGVIVDKLRKEGINSLESVVITKISKKYSGGIPYLMSQISIKQLILPENIRKTKLYRKFISLCSKNNIDIVSLPNMLKSRTFSSTENKKKSINSIDQTDSMTTTRKIEWSESETENKFILNSIDKKIDIEILKIHPGLKKLFIGVNGIKTDTFEIKNSNFFQIFECSIPAGIS